MTVVTWTRGGGSSVLGSQAWVPAALKSVFVGAVQEGLGRPQGDPRGVDVHGRSGAGRAREHGVRAGGVRAPGGAEGACTVLGGLLEHLSRRTAEGGGRVSTSGR